MNKKAKAAIQGIAFLLAVVCMIYGGYRGEVSVVFQKAVHICLECIGLG